VTGPLDGLVAAYDAEAARVRPGRPAPRHDYVAASATGCQHWRCREAAGYQAACCGHYQPAGNVSLPADGEAYCRPGRGCQS
jgi:hypothetical protein